MGPYGTLRDKMGSQMETYGTIWNIEGSHSTIKGLYETVRNLMGQYGSASDRMEQYGD